MPTNHIRTATIAMAALGMAGALAWSGPAAASASASAPTSGSTAAYPPGPSVAEYPPGPSVAGGHEQTLRLTTRTDQFVFADQFPPGPSVGDRLVFSDRVFRDGVEVGTAASTCTMVRVASPTVTCLNELTLVLPGGQLTLQGANDGPDHPPVAGEQVRFRLAVTGGTGQYRAARGDADGIDAGGGEEQYTIHLTK